MGRRRFYLFPLRDAATSPARVPEAPKLPVEEADTEFKRKFPPDTQLGQELAENARVWKVYREEAIQHDDGVLSGWNNTVDILLTFAGLFSAAVTAFVVESYQFLQPASLDLGMALYALAVNDTAALHTLATSSSHPSSSARWINGLWFTSLFFSLAAACFCILVKQWLDEYTARTRASSQNPKHWSRRRAFYFHAIDAWGVAGVISLLPLLLHASLFLFFAGMVVLLWALNHHIAVWLSALSGMLLLLYALSLVIPVWDAACPFATPLAKHIRGIWAAIRIRVLKHCVAMFDTATDMTAWYRHLLPHEPDIETIEIQRHISSVNIRSSIKRLTDTIGKSLFDQLIDRELLPSESSEAGSLKCPLVDDLDCEVLRWLVFSVSDSDANAVAFQALGGIVRGTSLDLELVARGIYSRITAHGYPSAVSGEPTSTEAARIIRSILHFEDEDPELTPYLILDCFRDISEYHDLLYFERSQSYPDLRLLGLALAIPLDPIQAFSDDDYLAMRNACTRLGHSPSLSSTALLILSIKALRRHHILLFLLVCDMDSIPSAEWSLSIAKIRGDMGICHRHDGYVPCNIACFIETLAALLQLQDVEDLDAVVLTRLLDSASGFLMAPGGELPVFLNYIASPSFLYHQHSDATLERIADYITSPRSWDQIDCLTLIWLNAWRNVGHYLRRRFRTVYGPDELIASALWSSMDGHGDEEWLAIRHRFNAAPHHEEILAAILFAGGSSDELIPSIWQLIATEKEDWSPFAFVGATQALVAAMCTLARNGECNDEFLTAFIAPVTVRDLVEQLFRLISSNSDLVEKHRSISLIICSHIMELYPSWWVEGMEQLAHEDGDLQLRTGWGETFNISQLQELAVEMMEECLQHGPCCECPLTVSPLAFDISLRTYTVFPFAVYPIVDGPESG